MITSRKPLPTLLYFYQGDLTQENVDFLLDEFADKDVSFRKVNNINDTSDMLEKCAYAAGTVPLIYFTRKATGVLTDGLLADPLERPSSHKPAAAPEAVERVPATTKVVTGEHITPVDANVAVKDGGDVPSDAAKLVATLASEPAPAVAAPVAAKPAAVKPVVPTVAK